MTQSSSQSAEEVDFNVYRKEYESKEHWNLRKWFMIHHWDSIEDEEEILCCAQLFVNIEFLGCRYSTEVMERIKLMSEVVPQIRAHRESRKNKLKRTFVTAKEATHAKYTKTDPKTSNGVRNGPIMFIPERPAYVEPTPFKIDINHKNTIKDENGWDSKDKMEWNRYVEESKFDGCDNLFIKLSEAQRIRNLRSLLKDVIVFESDEENDLNYCLNKTTACMRKIGKLELKFDDKKLAYFYVFNDQIIAEGKGETKKLAKKAVDEEFIKVLRANCYTIRSKVKFFSCEEVIKKDSTNKPTISQDTDQIQQDNLGFKLLAKLGWKGGSLGAHGTGIIDPIKLEIKIGKKGLGSEIEHFDQNYFRNLLKNFKKNDVEYDLIFSAEFSKEERAQIHQIAGQLNLRTKSYGKSSSRHLVISTRINPQVLRQKLIEGDEYLKEKYELISPPFVKVVKPKLI